MRTFISVSMVFGVLFGFFLFVMTFFPESFVWTSAPNFGHRVLLVCYIVACFSGFLFFGSGLRSRRS